MNGQETSAAKSINLDLGPLLKFFIEGDRQGLIAEFFKILQLFRREIFIANRDASIVGFLNYFLNAFFLFILDDRNKISADEAISFISLNSVIQNLTRISDFRNTTIPLSILSGKEGNFEKALILLGSYTEVDIDLKQFSGANSSLLIMWVYIILGELSNVSPVKYNRKIQLIDALDENVEFIWGHFELSAVYFGISYIESSRETFLKKKINALYKEENKQKLTINPHKTDKKRIGVVSTKWWTETAVYRSISQSVGTLFEDFDLTLITRPTPGQTIVTTGFKDIIEVPLEVLIEEYIPQIREKNLDVIFYPDIGMVRDSIVLSNKRLAPIQICSYGHPASTHSDEIDYWFGGQAVEHPVLAKDQYSERLVLLPELGIQSVTPEYEVTNAKNLDQFIIGCSWGCMKANPRLIQSLKRILDRAQKPIVFRFFPNWGAHQDNALLPWRLDLEAMLGQSHVEVIENLHTKSYMQKLEEAAFAIDSYPFGGFNTITDALYLQKPMVTFEGDRAFNRLASAVMRLMGLGELIAKSWETYEDLIVRLINDDSFRESVRAKITRAKFDEMIEKSTDPTAFRRAIDYLIENHERLQQDPSREPIVIQ